MENDFVEAAISLPRKELRYYEPIEKHGLDIDQIRHEIGAGAQNLVRGLGESKVMKAPLYRVGTGARWLYSQTLGRVFGQDYKSARREMDLAHTHFEDYLVDGTDIKHNPESLEFVSVQDAITIDELSQQHLENHPHLRDQLEDLAERNKKMMSDEKRWMDFMGWDPAQYAQFLLRGRPYFANISVSQDQENLQLFDVGMFDVPTRAKPFMYPQFLSQKRNMQKVGVDFV